MTRAAFAKFRRAARLHRPAALLGSALLLVALHLAGSGLTADLRYDRSAVAAGDWWRLVTCHVVHYDLRHLALNLGGGALLWWLYAPEARPRSWGVILLAAALAVGGGLYLVERDVAWYLGLSGLLHGAWAAAALWTARQRRLEALVSGALLLLKLALEQRHGALSAPLAVSLPVIVNAHLYGALGGLAAAIALRARGAPL